MCFLILSKSYNKIYLSITIESIQLINAIYSKLLKGIEKKNNFIRLSNLSLELFLQNLMLLYKQLCCWFKPKKMPEWPYFNNNLCYFGYTLWPFYFCLSASFAGIRMDSISLPQAMCPSVFHLGKLFQHGYFVPACNPQGSLDT